MTTVADNSYHVYLTKKLIYRMNGEQLCEFIDIIESHENIYKTHVELNNKQRITTLLQI